MIDLEHGRIAVYPGPSSDSGRNPEQARMTRPKPLSPGVA